MIEESDSAKVDAVCAEGCGLPVEGKRKRGERRREGRKERREGREKERERERELEGGGGGVETCR